MAAPLTLDHLGQLFMAAPPPDLTDSSSLYARARATATAVRIRFDELPTLALESLRVTAERATVFIATDVARTTECLRLRLDDPIAAAVCAHCHLRAWQDESPDVPLFPEEQVASIRDTTRRLITRLHHAPLGQAVRGQPGGCSGQLPCHPRRRPAAVGRRS